MLCVFDTEKPSTSKQNTDEQKDQDNDDSVDNIWKKPVKDDAEKTRLVFLFSVAIY